MALSNKWTKISKQVTMVANQPFGWNTESVPPKMYSLIYPQASRALFQACLTDAHTVINRLHSILVHGELWNHRISSTLTLSMVLTHIQSWPHICFVIVDIILWAVCKLCNVSSSVEQTFFFRVYPPLNIIVASQRMLISFHLNFYFACTNSLKGCIFQVNKLNLSFK